MKARYKLPCEILEADRQAIQLCRKFQIRKTHDGVMVWKDDNGWKWWRPFTNSPTSTAREQAEEFLFNKLPAIESEL